VGITSASLAHRDVRERGSISENVNFGVKASLVYELIAAAGMPSRTSRCFTTPTAARSSIDCAIRSSASPYLFRNGHGFPISEAYHPLSGLRLNLSKSGISMSAGPRGASVTVGKNGVYGNVGIPGSGLGWRERLDKPDVRSRRAGTRQAPPMPASAQAGWLATALKSSMAMAPSTPRTFRALNHR
jgi:hypothetical protein